MKLILTILAVLTVLLLNEAWWRLKKPNDEISRKLVHILVGSFVAIWPYYLSWLDIELLGLAFFIVVYTSKFLNIFSAIHSVQRPTWGEMCFALAVGGVALITHDRLIYMTAILQMAVADGLAAIIGSYFGKSNSYLIFGFRKSLAGSMTFFLMSLFILVNYGMHASGFQFGYIGLALAATALENFSIFGLDNFFVPMLIAIWLK